MPCTVMVALAHAHGSMKLRHMALAASHKNQGLAGVLRVTPPRLRSLARAGGPGGERPARSCGFVAQAAAALAGRINGQHGQPVALLADQMQWPIGLLAKRAFATPAPCNAHPRPAGTASSNLLASAWSEWQGARPA
jgi:hypothetical protein